MNMNAQEIFKQQTMLGINAGINASEVYFSPVVNQIPTLGIVGGITFKYISEPHLGIQLELNYTQKGWEEDLDTSNVFNRKCNYIELPFMTHIEIGKKKTKFLINFGPTVSYLISSSKTMFLVDENEMMSYYNTEIDNKIELGLCVGLGVLKSSKIGEFLLEARFNQGINNIFKSEEVFSYSLNQVLGVKMSYLFSLN